MRALLVVLIMAVLPLPAQRGVPSRDEISAAERSMYDKLRKFKLEGPYDVLGLPRGIYLDGYGTVFTAEVNLLQVSGMTVFRPAMSKEEIGRLREAKAGRMPEFRQLMKQLLVDAAATLDRVPPEEHVVVGVVLFYHRWEDHAGLPSMITMQARRGELLKMLTTASPDQRASLERTIQVREE